jgi:hypothetical protein
VVSTPTRDDFLFPSLPELDTRSVRMPSSDRLARWRSRADARLEAVLADFDEALLVGEEPASAADRAITELQAWIRRSAVDLRTPEGDSLIEGEVRERCVQAWSHRTASVLQRAEDDPDAVDRHLRLYVGMAFEASARGYAGLVAGA